MLNKTLTSALAGSALVLGLAFAGSASAVTLNACPAGFTTNGTAKVYGIDDLITYPTAADACQYITPPDNSAVANETNVNAAGFFNITTWVVAVAKQDLPSDAGQTGTWAITDANFSLYTYMITFKDGQGTNLTSFRLNGEYSSGGWRTPFVDPPFTGVSSDGKDVSHFTIFRSPSASVPEPATLGMLGLGLFGMAAIRRRKLGLKS